MKTFNDPTQIDQVRKLLKGKSVIVFFFMDGRLHCINSRPAWEKLSNMNLPYEFAEVESKVVPTELEISGFPHYQIIDKDRRTKKVDGSKLTVKELAKSLGLRMKGGRTRRNSRRLRSRVRKTLH
jgi:hypothetical protein